MLNILRNKSTAQPSSSADSTGTNGCAPEPSIGRQHLASTALVAVRTSSAPSAAPRVKLTKTEQFARFFREGKITNNKVRVLKSEKSMLEAELKANQRQFQTTAVVDYTTLEDFMVKTLGSHNNREEIRRNQDQALMREIIAESKTPLPLGFKPSMFMYAPADAMVVLNEKGKVNFALAELNSQNYEGTTSVPPEMHANFMAHYYRVGADWAEEHRKTSPGTPLLILFGSSGREGHNPKNNKSMADKMFYGQKIAHGAGPDCKCISADNAEHLYNRELQKKSECENEGIKYSPGTFWPLKNAVVVGYNMDYLKQIQTSTREDDGKKVAHLFGVQISHVMSDRLTHLLLSQASGLDERSFKYCNITMPEGNDKEHTFSRQEEYNAKMHAAIAGFDAAGLEKPVFHGTIERDPSKDLAGLADDLDRKSVV